MTDKVNGMNPKTTMLRFYVKLKATPPVRFVVALMSIAVLLGGLVLLIPGTAHAAAANQAAVSHPTSQHTADRQATSEKVLVAEDPATTASPEAASSKTELPTKATSCEAGVENCDDSRSIPVETNDDSSTAAALEYSNVPWYLFLTLLGVLVLAAALVALKRRRTHLQTLARLAERA